MGRFTRGLRAGWILRKLESGDAPIDPARLDRRATAKGTAYDLYEPDKRVRRTLIAVAGLTPRGERDARLVRFCQALADGGFRVASVELPGLKAGREALADRDAITDLALTLRAAHGGPIGLVGFSLGGGVALVAAGDPALRGALDPIVVFGPHADMEWLWEELATRSPDFGRPDADWRDDLFIQLVMAKRAADALALTSEERAELDRLLYGYCCEPDPAAERRFYEAALAHRDVGARCLEVLDRDQLRALSPGGKLGGLEARVMILADPHDKVVPPDQPRRLHDELAARGLPGGQRLLITPMLSHVTASSFWRLGDVARLLDMFGELF